MIEFAKKFKVKTGESKKKFVEKLNLNVAKMFIENNANPDDYVWSWEKGLDGDDFVNDEYTCRITAIKVK